MNTIQYIRQSSGIDVCCHVIKQRQHLSILFIILSAYIFPHFISCILCRGDIFIFHFRDLYCIRVIVMSTSSEWYVHLMARCQWQLVIRSHLISFFLGSIQTCWKFLKKARREVNSIEFGEKTLIRSTNYVILNDSSYFFLLPFLPKDRSLKLSSYAKYERRVPMLFYRWRKKKCKEKHFLNDERENETKVRKCQVRYQKQ